MKKTVRRFFVLCFLLSVSAVSWAEVPSKQDIALWPEIEPFQTGYLRVSDLHEIYYELCGNPHGTPVFVLHGGPGGSCSSYMRRFFNPDKFLIVLHDQRGAGKSKPHAEIRENTTQHLVQDIETLRNHLELGKIILFGGSWGTTLTLTYGETYPAHVSGMVLRGVFTATKEEIDHFYHGGVRKYFPETYNRLVESIPDPEKRPLPNTLLELIQSQNPDNQKKFSSEWVRYEFKISGLYVPDAVIENAMKTSPQEQTYVFGLFENYYMANDCFLEEGQIFKNAHKIKNIPVTIVNGRYDIICPPITAYRLHKILPNSKLIIAEGAGHWMGEPPIERALLEAMKAFE